MTEELSVRGSALTTFRGPPQSLLSGTITGLSYVAPTLAFKVIDTVGNPKIGSEEAFSTNVGVIYETDNFYGLVDYWSFSFEDSFQTGSFISILKAYIDNDCLGSHDVATNSTFVTSFKPIFSRCRSHGLGINRTHRNQLVERCGHRYFWY